MPRTLEAFFCSSLHHGACAPIFFAVLAIKKLIFVPPLLGGDQQINKTDSLSPVAPYRVVNIGNSQKIKLLDFIELIEKNLQKNFEKLNCMVIGISKDNIKKQAKFREKYNLTCELGADFENNVCEQLGVWVEKSMYGRKYMGIQRATFLSNEKGIITNVWEKVKVPGHADEVLAAVEKMKM